MSVQALIDKGAFTDISSPLYVAMFCENRLRVLFGLVKTIHDLSEFPLLVHVFYGSLQYCLLAVAGWKFEEFH